MQKIVLQLSKNMEKMHALVVKTHILVLKKNLIKIVLLDHRILNQNDGYKLLLVRYHEEITWHI